VLILAEASERVVIPLGIGGIYLAGGAAAAGWLARLVRSVPLDVPDRAPPLGAAEDALA
jgi:hypothetical protein